MRVTSAMRKNAGVATEKGCAGCWAAGSARDIANPEELLAHSNVRSIPKNTSPSSRPQIIMSTEKRKSRVTFVVQGPREVQTGLTTIAQCHGKAGLVRKGSVVQTERLNATPQVAKTVAEIGRDLRTHNPIQIFETDVFARTAQKENLALAMWLTPAPSHCFPRWPQSSLDVGTVVPKS